uniref:WGS project CBMI000000000 data, contig CS3069_c000473 n=1 Tax=Fusarium clavum TaxID=2594811 RepID=A0A090MGT3_9HYPO|nr:unnamed protein product [Fusarium clavum]
MPFTTSNSSSSESFTFQQPCSNTPNYICWHRGLNNANDNMMIALVVPWIQWPNNPLDDANAEWPIIRDKARQAVLQWRRVLREKVLGEAHQRHMKITSIILMNSQLRLTVDSLGKGEEHMSLFYGFVADELMEMDEVRDVNMSKSLIKWIGQGDDAYPVVRNFRSRSW